MERQIVEIKSADGTPNLCFSQMLENVPLFQLWQLDSILTHLQKKTRAEIDSIIKRLQSSQESQDLKNLKQRQNKGIHPNQFNGPYHANGQA